jgi:hypothetical protein
VADLVSLPTITVHRVWRPFDWNFFGSALLAKRGDVWRQLSPRRVRAVVNGGNCDVRAANWVHYLHAAYVPITQVDRSAFERPVGLRARSRGGTAALRDARRHLQ